MAGRPKGKFTKTLGVDVPHPFAKQGPPPPPKKVGRKPVQGPPPPPKNRGRPRTRPYIPPKQKKVVKPPRRIVMPTGRDMDDAIIKIQQQFLIDKNNLKKKNGGYTVTNRFSNAMLPGKKRTTRIT